MLSAVNAIAVNHRSLVPVSESVTTASSNALPVAANAISAEPDVLSISSPESRAVDDGVFQRTALAVRARWQVKETDDGQLRIRANTKLRFAYDFQAADGTQIRIRAKANLQYSQTSDGDTQSQSLKIRVKARVSILQQDVSSGVSPLAEDPEIPSEAQSAIAQALELFQKVTDKATSLFLENNPLDGDQLIAGIVEAFNELAGSISGTPLPITADPQPAPAADLIEPVAYVAADPAQPVAVQPIPVEPLPPVILTSEPASEASPQDVASPATNDLAANVEPSETLVSENSPVAAQAEPEVAAQTDTAQPAADEQVRSSSNSVLLKLRFQVIQSLTHLVGEFDSGSSSLLFSQSIFKASANLVARYNVAGPGATGSATNTGIGIDTQA